MSGQGQRQKLTIISVIAIIAGFVVITYVGQSRSLWLWGVGASVIVAGGGLIVWHWGQPSMRLVIGIGVLLRLLVFWWPPSLSDDAYRYVWDGRVQELGHNPYAYTPDDAALSALHNSKVFERLNSKSYYSVYPPVSQLLFRSGVQMAGEDWRAAYYSIKLMLVLLEVLGLLLLSRMARARVLLLYAWHPLVIIETAGQAHTESAMLFFLVVGLYALRKSRGFWAGVGILLAGFVKLYPLFFLPVLMRKVKGWHLLFSASLGLWLLLQYDLHLYFTNLLHSLDLYVRLFEFNAGPYYALKQLLLWWTGEDWSKWIGPFFRTLFFLSLPLIYYASFVNRWSLPKAFTWIAGSFLFFATTIHPWYLLVVLALGVLTERPGWHWHWLALSSLGTYLFYVDQGYWLFVVLGWAGWAVLALYKHAPPTFQSLQRLRGQRKAQRLRRLFPCLKHMETVLDLGAGEGYVGQALRQHSRVTLCDVISFNKTDLPLVLYDGRRLPFEDRAYDACVLYFVLHHAADPERVLEESFRVTRRIVVVVESVYTHPINRKLLVLLDTLANRLRSGGLMATQEPFLRFDTTEGWLHRIASKGGRVLAVHHKGRWIHRQAFFLIAPPASP